MGSHSPTMRLSSLPLFLCLLVSASGTFRDKEKIVKEGGKKEEGGGCFEVYHTEEQLQYKDVCEQSFREVCGTEYSEECHDEPTTRLEEQCDTSVVSEPVKVCTPGRHIRFVTQHKSSPSGKSALPASHASARGACDVADPREENRENVARGNSSRRPFSFPPCSSRPRRLHRSLVDLGASGFLTGIATSTQCQHQKRFATLNKTQPYATKSKRKRR